MVKGRFARVCVEMNLQQPLVPIINVMGRRQEVEYEGLYRVCYKSGQFGHRVDQCISTPSPAGASSTPGGSSAPSSSAPMRSTPANPYGPWLMPAHVRRRMEQTQKRMSNRAEPSAANEALNAQIDKDVHASCHFTKGATHDNRGGQGISAGSADGRLRTTVDIAAHSKFAVLGDVNDDDNLADKLSTLKQLIIDIPGPSGPSGVAHARTKNTKPKNPKVTGPVSKNKGKAPALLHSTRKDPDQPSGTPFSDPPKSSSRVQPTSRAPPQRAPGRPGPSLGPSPEPNAMDLDPNTSTAHQHLIPHPDPGPITHGGDH